MQKTLKLFGIVLVGAMLSACVSSDIERAGVGAAAGAGAAVILDGDIATGAIVGAAAVILDGDIATGAIVGAAGGALCDDVGLCRR